MRYVPIMELPFLIIMVLVRAAILRRRGIKAIVFGDTDKTDFFIIPVVFCSFYAILSAVFDLPFPYILKRAFWDITILNWAAIVICSISLIWFGITLTVFGNSFRVGIDEKTTDALVTTGPFAFSRNPIYVSFIAFFLGIFLAYATVITGVFLLFLVILIHRQILREEKFLESFYGKKYEEYCVHVRRYI